MIQDPHGASVKALEHPLWFSCAFLPLSCAASQLPSPPFFVLGRPCVGFFVLPLLLRLFLLSWSLCFVSWLCWFCVGVVVSPGAAERG